MGWSSWNTFRVNISEDLIKQTADAMVSKGLKAAGYNYVNIDDGYFGGRDASGNLQYNATKFPNGMKVVADYIHSQGLKAGLYSEAGNNTCGSIYDGDTYGVGSGLYGHEDADCDLFFTQWGYDFIKVDYCGGRNQGLNEKTQYTKIANAIQKAGENVRLNVCRWSFPGTWVTELAGSWRIDEDIRNSFSGTYGVAALLERNLYLSAYASPGHYNDMDMMQLGRGMNVEEEKSHFGIWCIMSSPLLIGCDLRTIPQATLDIIKNTEVIAINQDTLGLQAQLVAREGNRMVLAKPIVERQGKIRAVALFNAESAAKTIRVNFKDIQLSEKATVRDLWTHTDKGTFTGYYEVSVPAHGTAMLRIEGESSFDKTRFQGEDAFMNNFSAISSSNNFAKPQEVSVGWVSGGYKMTNLGKSSTNWAEFRNVYSTSGGNYTLRVFYYSPENRTLRITINGGSPIDMPNLNSGSIDIRDYADISIHLNQGNNVIRLTSNTTAAWAPDIDKIELIAEGSSPESDNFDKQFVSTFPVISSSDASNETWYNIQFKNGGHVIQDMGENTNILTKNLNEAELAQQWKVIHSPTPSGSFKYQIKNKSGRGLSRVSSSETSDGFYQTTATASAMLNFDIVATTNSTYSPAWELKRQGSSKNMNQYQYNYPAGQNLVNVRISEWTANDQNNPLSFIPVKTTTTAMDEIKADDSSPVKISIQDKTLTVEKNMIARVDIYTITGQKVYGKTDAPFSFYLPALGYYLVAIQDNHHHVETKKIVLY
jgi:hypothetical protein